MDNFRLRNKGILVFAFAVPGVLQPLTFVRQLLSVQIAGLEPGLLTLAIVNTLVIWASLLLAATGKVLQATHLFVWGSLTIFSFSYFFWGLSAQLPYQLWQVCPLLIAGLFLERGPMWLSLAWMSAATLLGGWRDMASANYAQFTVTGTMDSMIRTAAALIVIGAILDRAVNLVQTTLASERRRSNDLAHARDRLQIEMRERERSRELLLHSQKVEAVGRLSSGVAHDFGNLLSLTQGYIDQAKRAKSTEDTQRCLEGIESSTRRAVAVCQQLLSFSRQDFTRQETFEASHALEQMRPILRQLLSPIVHLHFTLTDNECWIRFDRSQFELLVINLAANAGHAMPEGGTFRVESRIDDGKVVLCFHDTGCGIPAEVQQQMFEPFFTTKPAGKGVGLGLAVARDLVHEAHGSIGVRSQPGTGTTLWLSLPLQSVAAQANSDA